LLKSENDLTQAAIEIRSNPTSFTALGADALLKEEFREIFESSQNWADGTLSL